MDMSGENPKVHSGCVPFSAAISAYYGLYYYQGCEDPDLNWVRVRKMRRTAKGSLFGSATRIPTTKG